MSTRVLVSLALLLAAGCSSSKPSTPTTPPPTGGTSNAAPALDGPTADEQLATLRPTLRVKNGTSTGTGARTYEFQISDRSDFGSSSGSSHFTVSLTRAGIGEATGTTSFAVDQDLQPATRFFWRARWVQGSTTGEWSSTFTFRTQIVGYNRPGELYDPLVNGATVAETRVGQTSFVDGRGMRLHDTNAYARYRLGRTLMSGEISVDVEGLSTAPISSDGDTAKLKILSMDDNPGDHYQSNFLMNLQYRGLNGNPDHAISFKMLMDGDDEDRKLEPDLATRIASIRSLNPATTYHWKATWTTAVRVIVQEGGAGGPTIYDFGQSSTKVYNPATHFAYLGVNNRGEETGSWPAIYRNFWVGDKARPASLGSAMTPR